MNVTKRLSLQLHSSRILRKITATTANELPQNSLIKTLGFNDLVRPLRRIAVTGFAAIFEHERKKDMNYVVYSH